MSGLWGRVGIAKLWTKCNKFSQQTGPEPHPLRIQGSLPGAAGAVQTGGLVPPWGAQTETWTLKVNVLQLTLLIIQATWNTGSLQRQARFLSLLSVSVSGEADFYKLHRISVTWKSWKWHILRNTVTGLWAKDCSKANFCICFILGRFLKESLALLSLEYYIYICCKWRWLCGELWYHNINATSCPLLCPCKIYMDIIVPLACPWDRSHPAKYFIFPPPTTSVGCS